MFELSSGCIYPIKKELITMEYNGIFLNYNLTAYGYRIVENYRRSWGIYDVHQVPLTLTIDRNLPVFQELKKSGTDEHTIAHTLHSDPNFVAIRSFIRGAWNNQPYISASFGTISLIAERLSSKEEALNNITINTHSDLRAAFSCLNMFTFRPY